MTTNHLENKLNSVVRVLTASGSGSGFIADKYGVIVTNFHVIKGFRQVSVELTDRRRLSCEVLSVNTAADIAILVPNMLPQGLPEMKFNDSGKITAQDKVWVAGYPLGMSLSVTAGVVSAARMSLENQEYIQTDAAINPGNSGGPVFNSDGEIVGLTTSKARNAENMGFILPIAKVKHELESMPAIKTGFHVRCPSCDTHLKGAEENCGNCGDHINPNVYDEYKLGPIQSFIESSLQGAGCNPTLARSGPEYWEFYSGSALVRIFVYQNTYLYLTSPLVNLPKTGLDALFQHLLVANFKPYCLGINEKTIFASYRCHLTDLESETQKNRIKSEIANFLAKADALDNYLITKFGCEPSQFFNPMKAAS